jgi:hypothetical protein
MEPRRKPTPHPVRLDLNSPATAEAFEVAAQAYTARSTKTKASAIETLYREGILTKAGRLTKPYADNP